jgi:uncharacterized protein
VGVRETDFVARVIASDPLRFKLLRVVRDLRLPDCWIAAGFVRNAVWDHLHSREPQPPSGDIDVIWFDTLSVDAALDRNLEERLVAVSPGFTWSVKNQARMHIRNGDGPYQSATDAMCYWPETATAVAARLCCDGRLEISAPLGLDDLLTLRLKPTARFLKEKRDVFDQRLQCKDWRQTYPLLQT